MNSYEFIDNKGTFRMKNPEYTSYLYFPLAGDNGVKSTVSPLLSGDFKTSQNSFLLQPISSEELHTYIGSRNFWCFVEGKGAWSASGVSAKQEALHFTNVKEDKVEKEEVTLEAGILWHSLNRISKEMGLASNILSFVPVEDHQIEIMKVDIKNISEEIIHMTSTAAIPLYCRSADNIRDHRHVTSLLHRIKTREYGIAVNPTLTFDERGHKKNKLTYFVYGCSENETAPIGFYPTVKEFIGEGGTFHWPEAILKNKSSVPADVEIDGYEAMGGIRFEKTTLKPGEMKSYVIIMGIVENQSECEELFKKYNTLQKVSEHLDKMKKYWQKQTDVRFKTADKNFNNYMNWVSFQPILRRIYGCSFLPHHDYGKGGRGWRDLWQDCLALIIMEPNRVRNLLLDNFKGVRFDGTNATIIGEKQGEFKADRNNITRVWMDHGVWPLITTKFYIDQTGDIELLLEETSYFKDNQISRGEEKDLTFDFSNGKVLRQENMEIYQGSILEHLLLQNLTAFYDVGEHNHIRLRDADWNDALDMAPARGESVAFTAAYAMNLQTLADFIDVLQKKKGIKEIEIAKEILLLLSPSYRSENQDVKDINTGSGLDNNSYVNIDNILMKKEIQKKFLSECKHKISGNKIMVSCQILIHTLTVMSEWIKSHIRENEWISLNETGWFNGYYDNNGRRVEGNFINGVRMMLTSQVFTIMSGTATTEQVSDIVKSADRYLYQEDIGGYRLNTNFHEVKEDLGRMFGFAYGHKENGAVFSHMVVMYANALYQRGYIKEGYKALNTLYKHSSNFEVSRIYPGIPEYFNDEGRGMYHYLTGAASWYMLTVITQMYGVKGVYGDLSIHPKLCKEQFDTKKRASIELSFANRKLKILYVNLYDKEIGEYQLGEIYVNNINIGDALDLVQRTKDTLGYEYLMKRELIKKLSKDNVNTIMIYLE